MPPSTLYARLSSALSLARHGIAYCAAKPPGAPTPYVWTLSAEELRSDPLTLPLPMSEFSSLPLVLADSQLQLCFLDVVAAFYQMIREGIFVVPQTRDEWLRFLGQAQWHPLDAQNLLSLLDRPISVIAQSMPEHLQAVVAAAHSATWLLLSGDTTLLAFLRGALQGDPTADYAFTLVAAEMFSQIEMAATIVGLAAPQCEAPPNRLVSAEHMWPRHMPISVSFVDDGALLLEANATCIVEDVAALAALADEAARRHMVRLSYKPGKTEVLVAPAGKGSRSVRQMLWAASGAAIPLERQGVALICTAAYQHLGGIITVSGAMAP